jgi:hypothetical protein
MPAPAPKAPTPEERAAFLDAEARCQVEDDCEDLASMYETGRGTPEDQDLRMAANLKGCLGGVVSLCRRSVFMRPGVAAPGTQRMAAAHCAGEEPDKFICESRADLAEDEAKAAPAIRAACAALPSLSENAAPATLGPLVDRCPGLATPAQRARARLFRSEADIARAHAQLASASPRQLRSFYERLQPLEARRADEALELGMRRFGAPRTPAFDKAREETRNIPFQHPRMELCTVEETTAYLSPVNERPSALSMFLRFALPVVFPAALPFYVVPDIKPSPAEQQALDNAAKARAAQTETALRHATGASRFVWLQTCADVDWFREARARRAP